jgi:hypothetical protein
MGASIAGAMKVSAKIPVKAGKKAAGAGGVFLGSIAILSKNLSGNYGTSKGEDDSTFSFMPIPKSSTGNPAIDLLNVLQFLQYMELFLVLVLGFYFVLVKLE